MCPVSSRRSLDTMRTAQSSVPERRLFRITVNKPLMLQAAGTAAIPSLTFAAGVMRRRSRVPGAGLMAYARASRRAARNGYGAAKQIDQAAVKPPSTTNSEPVVNADSSLARKSMVRATSIG
jgi:hypothetical protein